MGNRKDMIVESAVAVVTVSVLVSGLVACAPQGNGNNRLRAERMKPTEQTALQVQSAFGANYQPNSQPNMAFSQRIEGLALEVFPTRELAVQSSAWQPGIDERRRVQAPSGEPVVTQSPDGRIRLRAQAAQTDPSVSPSPSATPSDRTQTQESLPDATLRLLVVFKDANQPLIAIGVPSSQMTVFEVLNSDQFGGRITVEGSCSGDRCETVALMMRDTAGGTGDNQNASASVGMLFKRVSGTRYSFAPSWVGPRAAGEVGAATLRPDARIAMRQSQKIRISAPERDLPPIDARAVSPAASPSPSPSPSATPSPSPSPSPSAAPSPRPQTAAPAAAAPTVDEPE